MSGPVLVLPIVANWPQANSLSALCHGASLYARSPVIERQRGRKKGRREKKRKHRKKARDALASEFASHAILSIQKGVDIHFSLFFFSLCTINSGILDEICLSFGVRGRGLLTSVAVYTRPVANGVPTGLIVTDAFSGGDSQ